MPVMEKNREKDYKKVAKLVVAMGVEQAMEVLKYLNESEIKKVLKEVMEVQELEPQEKDAVIKDFAASLFEAELPSSGGPAYAKELAYKLYDKEKAESFLNSLEEENPFKFIENIETEKVYEVLKHETSQTVAIVFSMLSPSKSAEILSFFPKEKRAEIARRIGIIEKSEPDAEMIAEVVKILKEKLSVKKEVKIKGVDKLTKILLEIDKKSQKEIIDRLEKEEPEIANTVKRQLFRFEDLKNVEDRYVQRILREVESKDLAIALKGTSEELKNKIFSNMSERGAEMVKDDMEAAGPLKRQVVDEAQQKIISVIRKLEAGGEIVIDGGNADVVV